MIAKTIHVFTEKEEELVSLLVRIGTTKNVAKVLVYLANLKNATALEIEQGTDLRQPDVSVGLKYLEGRGWVEYRKIPTLGKGRPAKLWTLKMPIDKIMEIIGGENRARYRHGPQRYRTCPSVRQFIFRVVPTFLPAGYATRPAPPPSQPPRGNPDISPVSSSLDPIERSPSSASLEQQ